MNFSEAMFYENYLTSDFHTNIVVCLLVKMASKTGEGKRRNEFAEWNVERRAE